VVRRAPAIKPGRFTILSTRPCADEVADRIDHDPRLRACFTA
jgi:hypothetical protein